MPPISAQICFQLQPFSRLMPGSFSVRSARVIADVMTGLSLDLPSPTKAYNEGVVSLLGFAQAGNRHPLFGIMLRKRSKGRAKTLQCCTRERPGGHLTAAKRRPDRH